MVVIPKDALLKHLRKRREVVVAEIKRIPRDSQRSILNAARVEEIDLLIGTVLSGCLPELDKDIIDI